ncbi:MAG TPA: hypothetical protein PJ991_12140, partial [Kiritimatiellia bacterium]|nr:hypothetical protein [Kiritimatiellia bacterium]
DYEYEQERWGIPQPILILILLVIMTDGWESMNVLQRRAGMGGRCGASWPKGVFRFKSFEEADEWWTKKMVWRSWHGATSDLIHLAP